MTTETICEAHGHDYVGLGGVKYSTSLMRELYAFKCEDCGDNRQFNWADRPLRRAAASATICGSKMEFTDDQRPVRRAVAKTYIKGAPVAADSNDIAPLKALVGKIIHIHSVDFVKLLLQGKFARSSDGLCQIFLSGRWQDVKIDDNTFTWGWIPEFLENADGGTVNNAPEGDQEPEVA